MSGYWNNGWPLRYFVLLNCIKMLSICIFILYSFDILHLLAILAFIQQLSFFLLIRYHCSGHLGFHLTTLVFLTTCSSSLQKIVDIEPMDGHYGILYC